LSCQDALSAKRRFDWIAQPTVRIANVPFANLQDVRKGHLHRGEFHSSKFVRNMVKSSYQDPTFDRACRVLAPTTQTTIILWLSRAGAFTIPTLQRRRTLRR